MNFVISFLNLLLLQTIIILTLATSPVEAALTVEDCGKCHFQQYRQIAESGKSHRSKVTCLDCHENHRPRVKNNIPNCRDCHGDIPHEGKIDCSACHKKKMNCNVCHLVHRPFAWPGNESALRHCRLCHPGPFNLLQASTSKHRALECADCHLEHGYLPRCSDCHGRPHGEGTHGMFPQCSICHNTAHNLNNMAGK